VDVDTWRGVDKKKYCPATDKTTQTI